MSWKGSPKSSEDGEKHIWRKIFHKSYCTKYIYKILPNTKEEKVHD